MVKIKVDRGELKRASKIILSSIDEEKKKYKLLKSEIELKSSSWQGSDYLLYKKKWDEVLKQDSEFYKQLEMLKSYAQYLQHCENEYYKLQNRISSKAKRLL